MRRIADILSWGFILLFAIPTVLIMASWNSLPGDPMYGIKRAFENALLIVAKPSFAAEANLHVQYTERRMDEVRVLLAKEQSKEGLSQLSQQIRATRTVIERAPDKTAQKTIARKYITTLKNVSRQLEEARPSLPPTAPTGANEPAAGQNPTNTPVPTRSPGVPYRSPTPVPPVTPVPEPTQEPEPDIDDVQEEIDDTIEELEQLSLENTNDQPEPTPTPTEARVQQPAGFNAMMDAPPPPTAQPTAEAAPTAEPTPEPTVTPTPWHDNGQGNDDRDN